MSSMVVLVRLCVAGDRRAWELFLRVAGGSASGPIRRLLSSLRIDPTLADDLDQELYLYLRGPGSARLGAFRGASRGELRRFLAVLALRFARTRLVRLRREADREARALRAHARAECDDGPTESEVRAALDELEGLLDKPDRARLHAVLDPIARPDVPARTLRHWSEGLARRVAGETPDGAPD